MEGKRKEITNKGEVRGKLREKKHNKKNNNKILLTRD